MRIVELGRKIYNFSINIKELAQRISKKKAGRYEEGNGESSVVRRLPEMHIN